MKKVLVILLAFVLVFGLAACGDKPAGNDAASDGDTIKIGWLGSLTGDQAVWGTCESQTLEMLIEQKNAEGGLLGKKIELIKYDTKADVNEAINVTKRLVSQDKVAAIIGPNASGQAIAMAGVLTDAKTAGIATVATNPKVTVDNGVLNPYSYRICFIDPYQGKVLGAYAAKKLNFKNAAILYDIGSDYAQGSREYFIQAFEAEGGKIVADEAFNSGDTDFRAQLTKIKEANPEVLLLPGYYKETALIANQARDLGITAVFLGGDGWPSEELNNMAGKAIEGSYIVNHLDFNDPKVKPLQDAYHTKYGEKASIELNAYMAHDSFLVICAAIEKAGTADPEKVAEAMTQVEVEGLTGHIKLSAEDHNPEGKEAVIQQYTYDNGKVDIVFVERFSPDK